MTNCITFFRTFIILAILIIWFPTDAVHGADNAPQQTKKDNYLSNVYHALVVGVGSYDNWPALPNTARDAEEIAGVLRQAGFSVTLKIDPASRELKAALGDLAKKGKDPASGLLFYYAGHGETRILADKTRLGYIIPRDCPPSQEGFNAMEKLAVSTRELEAFARDLPSNRVLMLFDSSFSGGAFSIKPASLKIIDKKSTLPARQYIIAGNADEPLPNKSGFKKHLIQGLRGEADYISDGYITASELGVYLTRLVAKTTRGQQHPQYGTTGDSRGDFVFRPLQALSDGGRLYVKTTPADASVKILNIKPRFQNGIELAPGKYHLEVSASNHISRRKWIDLARGEDKTISFSLQKFKPVFVNQAGMKFSYIRPGKFSMGSQPGRHLDGVDEESHQAALTRGYYIQTTEVTAGQFEKFIQATGYTTGAEKQGGCWIKLPGTGWRKKKQSRWNKLGSWESGELPQTGRHPVTCVTWNDAMAFIAWLNGKNEGRYDLPTEAEWEYACRAGTTTPFSFGNCLTAKQANFSKLGPGFPNCSTLVAKTRFNPLPAASFPGNPWKLYDMHGNVAEWCRDWYGSYTTEYSVKNPKGPSIGTEKVIRGGHWAGTAGGCRSARRGSFKPDTASDVIGFRVVFRYE